MKTLKKTLSKVGFQNFCPAQYASPICQPNMPVQYEKIQHLFVEFYSTWDV